VIVKNGCYSSTKRNTSTCIKRKDGPNGRLGKSINDWKIHPDTDKICTTSKSSGFGKNISNWLIETTNALPPECKQQNHSAAFPKSYQSGFLSNFYKTWRDTVLGPSFMEAGITFNCCEQNATKIILWRLLPSANAQANTQGGHPLQLLPSTYNANRSKRFSLLSLIANRIAA